MTDKRTKNAPINVNDQIQDRTIRHMVHIERYKKGEIRKIANVLNRDILPDLNRRIEERIRKITERGSDTGKATTNRLRSLEKELTKLMNRMTDSLRKPLTADMVDLTRDEIDWQVQVIRDELGFDLDMEIPNAVAVARIAENTAFAGSTLDQWFKNIETSTQRKVMTAVNRGIVEGKTTTQIMRDIRGTKALNYTDGVWNSTRHQVETVARTTVNHVTNQARTELFKANDDIIDSIKWLATLDSRTSIICAGLDGRIFEVDKGIRPPAHPNCRSVMTAVLKDWKALGLRTPTAGQRASINGQVPASTTYPQWLKRQSLNVQQEVLGVSKAKLFNQGELDITRFTDSNLKPLTLDQLRVAEKTAFNRANL